jgi:ribosome modulation factor
MSDDPAAAVTAVTPDKFLTHWRNIREAKDDMGSASTEVARSKKAAKRDGVDMGALKWAEELSGMDEDQRETRMRLTSGYCDWIGLPLGAWALSGKAVVEEPKDSSREEFSRWQAGKEGYAAGLAGAPKENNPHRAGSFQHVEWAKKWKPGFDANQKKIATQMAKGARRSAKKADGAISGKMAAAGEGLPAALN